MNRIANGRTSISHPLIIDTLPFHNGALGLTFCPGKKQAYAMTGAWNRDIDLDQNVVEAWGATTVISLLEEFEYDELQVPELPGKFATRFRWLDLPIRISMRRMRRGSHAGYRCATRSSKSSSAVVAS
jgi:hypothetical protein